MVGMREVMRVMAQIEIPRRVLTDSIFIFIGFRVVCGVGVSLSISFRQDVVRYLKTASVSLISCTVRHRF